MAGWGKRRPDDVERVCKECGVTKPIGEYYRVGGWGRRRVCKACFNASRRVDRADPGEVARRRERRREQYRADPKKVIRNVMESKRRRKAREGNPVAPAAPLRWVSSIRASIELERSAQWVRVACQSGRLRAVKAPNKPRGGLVWMIDPVSLAEVRKKL